MFEWTLCDVAAFPFPACIILLRRVYVCWGTLYLSCMGKQKECKFTPWPVLIGCAK